MNGKSASHNKKHTTMLRYYSYANFAIALLAFLYYIYKCFDFDFEEYLLPALAILDGAWLFLLLIAVFCDMCDSIQSIESQLGTQKFQDEQTAWDDSVPKL